MTTARMAVAAALLACAALAATGCGGSDEPAKQPSPTAGWTTYRDGAHGLRVQFPSDWRRAHTSLTPHLSDPREVLSLGTGPLRQPGPRDCAHMPVGALDAIGPRDALVSIQERRSPSSGYKPRPPRFELNRANRIQNLECVSARPGRLDTWWMSFRDHGRGFYALVALGPDAPSARRDAAERVLNSLRFSAKTGRNGG